MKKKIIKLKIDCILKYWNYLSFLRTGGILIFCQNLSLNAISDLTLSLSLKDNDYRWKFLNKDVMNQLMDKKFLMKMKNFRKVLLLNKIEALADAEKILKKNKVLIMGFYMQNVFFFKKDFDIKKKDKRSIFEALRNRIVNFFLIKKKIVINLKTPLIKLILLLKKRDS